MTTIYLAHATSSVMIAFFFFNDTATTEIYTLSLHDALPISYRRGAVSITKARTAPGSSGASVSGTSGTLEPQGSNRRTVAPGEACTLRGIPSSSGSARVPAGVKLGVSVHAARPGGGRDCGGA